MSSAYGYSDHNESVQYQGEGCLGIGLIGLLIGAGVIMSRSCDFDQTSTRSVSECRETSPSRETHYDSRSTQPLSTEEHSAR
jgi:hypothetical protein